MESSVDEVKKAIDKAIAIETPKLQNWQTLKVDVQFVKEGVRVDCYPVIKIDKDIPIPLKSKQAPSRKHKGLSDAIRTLEINDSFFIPIPDNMSAKSFRDTIFSRVSLIKKKRKDKLSVTTREVDDGIRVWRIA